MSVKTAPRFLRLLSRRHSLYGSVWRTPEPQAGRVPKLASDPDCLMLHLERQVREHTSPHPLMIVGQPKPPRRSGTRPDCRLVELPVCRQTPQIRRPGRSVLICPGYFNWRQNALPTLPAPCDAGHGGNDPRREGANLGLLDANGRICDLKATANCEAERAQPLNLCRFSQASGSAFQKVS